MSGKPVPTTYPTGNGIMLCGACAEPLAFHKGVEMCPAWAYGEVVDKDNYNKQNERHGRKPRLRA